eukprot:2787463-Pyramimonas_sp.AAC.1
MATAPAAALGSTTVQENQSMEKQSESNNQLLEAERLALEEEQAKLQENRWSRKRCASPAAASS